MGKCAQPGNTAAARAPRIVTRHHQRLVQVRRAVPDRHATSCAASRMCFGLSSARRTTRYTSGPNAHDMKDFLEDRTPPTPPPPPLPPPPSSPSASRASSSFVMVISAPSPESRRRRRRLRRWMRLPILALVSRNRRSTNRPAREGSPSRERAPSRPPRVVPGRRCGDEGGIGAEIVGPEVGFEGGDGSRTGGFVGGLVGSGSAG